MFYKSSDEVRRATSGTNSRGAIVANFSNDSLESPQFGHRVVPLKKDDDKVEFHMEVKKSIAPPDPKSLESRGLLSSLKASLSYPPDFKEA